MRTSAWGGGIGTTQITLSLKYLIDKRIFQA
jgi:hypothetical protein